MVVMMRMNNALCGDCWWMGLGVVVVEEWEKRLRGKGKDFGGLGENICKLEFRTTASASSRPGRIACRELQIGPDGGSIGCLHIRFRHWYQCA